MKELIDWIKNEMPYGGEWKDEDNSDPFIEVAEFFINSKEVDLMYIKTILHDLYCAVSNEFGA
jgi:hypothetical protein